MDTGRNDMEIVLDIKGGSRVAFNELMSKYGRYVHLVAIGRIGIHDDRVQDIAQDVFVKLWESRAKLVPEHPIQALLYTITIQTCINYLKRNRRYNQYLSDYSDQANKVQQPEIHDHHLSEWLHEAIEKITPETRRTIVRKRFMDQKTYDEIVEETGISTQNARLHVSRGLAFLRSFLKKLP